jgi:hypothetical protein
MNIKIYLIYSEGGLLKGIQKPKYSCIFSQYHTLLYGNWARRLDSMWEWQKYSESRNIQFAIGGHFKKQAKNDQITHKGPTNVRDTQEYKGTSSTS